MGELLIIGFVVDTFGLSASMKVFDQSDLAAMGRKSNIEGLGLEAAGVNTHRSGIVVNKRLKTIQKQIYAAGDVNGGYQFMHAADRTKQKPA
ncbi:MAG: FAD-dependent oxidoreductase [Desulfatitalea sp.]|nr:FAD-dependent oxidoreductase [Desulfatitalea sp.]NNJ99960.1 FAD-dependent oxidoreductase [Desulfatitalea sp.]